MDDTSRLVVAYGVFGEETADNALQVLKRAKYGPPKEILTDYRPQFFTNEGERKEKGINQFEAFLTNQGIRRFRFKALIKALFNVTRPSIAQATAFMKIIQRSFHCLKYRKPIDPALEIPHNRSVGNFINHNLAEISYRENLKSRP